MERTKYMQFLMTTTYPGVAIEAITGGFDGAWERLISRKLRTEIQNGNSEAEVIVDSVGGDYMKAAHLITSSKIPETLNY